VRALPTGTVTFLFTDVEGSTRLLHQLGDSYAEVLAEHRRVLRDAFSRHGGVEVDTQGDAFFVAFAKASDALAAAVESRQALEPGPIRVRTGIHTGEPLVTAEGYVGIDVHRAARIASAGHGGQILVSQSTRDLADADSLRDLGEHRLKDLSAPERIYQLGEGDFPRLKSLNQTNLPVQPTPLVGREEELAEVLELLRRNRLVTLTGAGGSGKTRLALQAAAELVDEFADGVWFTSLASLTDAALLEPTIAQVVGARDHLHAFVRAKELLLVLDNVEQLLPAAAAVVAELLAAQDLRVLATSRERLALSAEQEYPVPTLPLDHAAALFTQRARQLKPSFQPDEHVTEICTRLDGLPLALELAAARIKVLTPEQILERVGHSLDLLTAGARDAPERQRTLRATIDWSHALLTEHDRRLFAKLAVFAGSFDLQAAEEVCDADLDTLQSLLDKSLLRQTEDGRFFMLETIREYALELSELTDDQKTIRRRHADLALVRAKAPADHELHEWRVAVDRDYSDFRAALIWLRDAGDDSGLLQLASRLGAYWDGRMHLQEGRLWLEEALANPLGMTSERGWALATLGHIVWRQGDVLAARSLIDDTEAAARVLGDDALLAEAHAHRGGLEYTSGNLPVARGEYEKAVALFRANRATRTVAIMIHDLGHIAIAANDLPQARAHLEESLRLARQNGFDRLEPGFLGSLGRLELEDGKIDRAEHQLRESLRLALERDSVGPWTAPDLYVLAAALVSLSDARTACVLVGVSDAAMDLAGVAREPLDEEIRAEALHEAEAKIGRDAAVRACARGSAMTLVEAIEYILSLD
jgi:predicted ATPase/class 3 adenylate cyclase